MNGLKEKIEQSKKLNREIQRQKNKYEKNLSKLGLDVRNSKYKSIRQSMKQRNTQRATRLSRVSGVLQNQQYEQKAVTKQEIHSFVTNMFKNAILMKMGEENNYL